MNNDRWYASAFALYLLAPEGSMEEADWLQFCEYWQHRIRIDDIVAEGELVYA